MPKKNCQKIKMLKLVEILNRESDEAHPLPTNKLINRLAEYGITCDRRTLYKDMALLNELGYEVMSVVHTNTFVQLNLKILINAESPRQKVNPPRCCHLYSCGRSQKRLANKHFKI